MPITKPSDLVLRFDRNVIADLASDSGTPAADLSADPIVLAALSDAEGRVFSALTVADMYTPTDLAALTGTALDLFKRITCGLAMGNLMMRRQGQYQDYYRAAVDDAEGFLERLRKGERVFGGDAENRSAGLISIDGPSAVDVANMNLVTSRVKNFYPHAANRLPLNR
jgi:hypothetical protein